MRSRLLGMFGRRGVAAAEAPVVIERRDKQTKADQSPVLETAYGRRAEMYNGRRLLCEQVIMSRRGIMGRRLHQRHWLGIYVMGGQIEVRLFKPDVVDPYHGIVVTPRSDPLILTHGTQYEIEALTDANLMLLSGNYTNIEPATWQDYVQMQADEAPSLVAQPQAT